ncbi:MAG: MBL fold metallo-hydrolase [Actinobacteria bacterium]|nr:MBL fold metallo-hydrolase [Actinomycetota bacterium]
MKELADGVWQLSGRPADNINIYLLGDVLVDAGTVLDRSRIFKQLDGRDVSAHALTHAHFDHFGSSKAVCERYGVEFWAGADDVEAIERGKMVGKVPGLGRRMLPAAPALKVNRALREGDTVGDFAVLDTPGHSPGHVSFWRESDGVLVCGDVMWGYNPFLMRGGVREPYPAVSPDHALNRESARKLAALRPQLVLFGHGAPLRDTERFVHAVDQLPT